MAWKLFSKSAKGEAETWNIRTMFGPNLNFAATEAYKLLRTNIMFSLPNEGTCHVIGITSSVQSEGKSSTACNTAYALAEAGESVLLLEADMRRPTIASKLGLRRNPGLSNLLVARKDYHEVLQQCPLSPGMHVITSGDIPPNPSELLGSNRMAGLLEQLRAEYDYIIIDMPPVTAVSDAIVMSKLLDGVVVVVRSGVANQQMLAEAMRQLRMVDVRLLGFVYRDMDIPAKKYNRRYAKKYHSDYTKK